MTGLAGLQTGGFGVEHGARGRASSGPERALTYLLLFRRVVVALALAGAGLAWSWNSPWLAAAGLTIAVGEWMESTYYIGVLRWGRRSGVLAAPERIAGRDAG